MTSPKNNINVKCRYSHTNTCKHTDHGWLCLPGMNGQEERKVPSTAFYFRLWCLLSLPLKTTSWRSHFPNGNKNYMESLSPLLPLPLITFLPFPISQSKTNCKRLNYLLVKIIRSPSVTLNHEPTATFISASFQIKYTSFSWKKSWIQRQQIQLESQEDRGLHKNTLFLNFSLKSTLIQWYWSQHQKMHKYNQFYHNPKSQHT